MIFPIQLFYFLLLCGTMQAYLFSFQGKLISGEGTTFESGILYNSTMLIGACESNYAAGSVFVYTRMHTYWSLQSELFSNDAFPGDNFGSSVSLYNSTAFIGASMDDGIVVDSGSVYFYARGDTAWSMQSKILADNGSASDGFGKTVSLYDTNALIGAYEDDDKEVNAGSVYYYTQVNSYWSRQSKFTAGDGAAGDLFGVSVSLYETNALIGAVFDGDQAESAGSVYFYRQVDSHWSSQSKILAADGIAGDGFGVSVALCDTVGLIGAYAGSVYFYKQVNSYWSRHSKIVAADGVVGNMFGSYVMMQKSTVIIGSAMVDGTHAGKTLIAIYLFIFINILFQGHCMFMMSCPMKLLLPPRSPHMYQA
jgi:hypothetical protein